MALSLTVQILNVKKKLRFISTAEVIDILKDIRMLLMIMEGSSNFC